MMNLNLDPLTFFNEGDNGEQSLLQAAGLSLDSTLDELITSDLGHHDVDLSLDADLMQQTECILEENGNRNGESGRRYVETFQSNELDEILDRVTDSGLLALNNSTDAGAAKRQHKPECFDTCLFSPQALQTAQPDEGSTLSSGTINPCTHKLVPTFSMDYGDDSYLRRKKVQESKITKPSIGKSGARKPRKSGMNKKSTKGTFGIAKPKRPLSAFNYFFSYERAKLLGAPMNNRVGQQGPKRRHRKTHGKIAFTDLAKLISQKWKRIDPESFAFYEAKAAEDLVRYRTAMKIYKEEVAAMEKAGDAGQESEATPKNASNSPKKRGPSPLAKKTEAKRRARLSPIEGSGSGDSSIDLATALKEALDEKKRIRAAETTEPTDKVCDYELNATSRDIPVGDKINDELKRFLDEDVLSILKNMEAANPLQSKTRSPVAKRFPICRNKNENGQLTTESLECDIEPIPSAWKHILD